MRKEKFVIAVVAAIVGIVVALLAFFFYQSTKKISNDRIQKLKILNPTPTPKPGIFLTIDEPKDEDVVEKRIVKVSGRTNPNSKILIVTEENEEGAVASAEGTFSTDITLVDGENIIEVTAIAQNGETVTITRTVTFSTESF